MAQSKEEQVTITSGLVDGRAYAVIDNLFTEKELVKMENEFIRYKPLFQPPDKTGSAWNDKDTKCPIKKNNAVFLDNILNEPFASDIVQITNTKMMRRELWERLMENEVAFSYFRSNLGATYLLSYYEDSDEYKEHADSSIFTWLVWLNQEPKRFTGGDLILQGKKKIEFQRGRVVIFPGYVRHEVTPVKLTGVGELPGRCVISIFNILASREDSIR